MLVHVGSGLVDPSPVCPPVTGPCRVITLTLVIAWHRKLVCLWKLEGDYGAIGAPIWLVKHLTTSPWFSFLRLPSDPEPSTRATHEAMLQTTALPPSRMLTARACTHTHIHTRVHTPQLCSVFVFPPDHWLQLSTFILFFFFLSCCSWLWCCACSVMMKINCNNYFQSTPRQHSCDVKDN